MQSRENVMVTLRNMDPGVRFGHHCWNQKQAIFGLSGVLLAWLARFFISIFLRTWNPRVFFWFSSGKISSAAPNYIDTRHSTIAMYVVNRPIYMECKEGNNGEDRCRTSGGGSRSSAWIFRLLLLNKWWPAARSTWLAGRDGCARLQRCNWIEWTDGTNIRWCTFPWAGESGWWVEVAGYVWPVVTSNPSKQEAKGGSDKPRP